MARHGCPGTAPAGQDPAAENGQHRVPVQSQQVQFRLVQADQSLQGRGQQPAAGHEQDYCHCAANQAVPQAQVEERTAHESVAGTQQLDHFDLIAARLYVQPNCVADNDDHGGNQAVQTGRGA